MEKIIKVWGWEEIIVNNEKYCAKFLNLHSGARSSIHYHAKKHETFMLLKGSVELWKSSKPLGEIDQKMVMKLKEPVTIPALVPHRFIGNLDSTILEVSTPHSDQDVYRLEPSKASESKAVKDESQLNPLSQKLSKAKEAG